jgi:hypothetical protein
MVMMDWDDERKTTCVFVEFLGLLVIRLAILGSLVSFGNRTSGILRFWGSGSKDEVQVTAIDSQLSPRGVENLAAVKSNDGICKAEEGV